jgi:epoxyqueuosine reductase QueG
MIATEGIKSIALNLGADKCGIAGTDRFSSAPAGFHPTDIWPKCKSVVVFLKKLPPEVIMAKNPVVYTHTAHILYVALDQIGMSLCYHLEKLNIHAVPVPTDDPYLYWDAENKHGMAILSMRHAAFNAGLGILGRNSLLINRELGNMVYIGAVLTDKELEPDPVIDDFTCPSDCSLCLDDCPVHALDGVIVNQKLCREFSCLRHIRGWDIYTCNECRKVCPMRSGEKGTKAKN